MRAGLAEATRAEINAQVGADQDRGGLAAHLAGAPNRLRLLVIDAVRLALLHARVPTATVMGCALSRTMLILEARDGPMMATSSFRVALEAHDPCEARPRGSQDYSYDTWSRRFGPARQKHGPDQADSETSTIPHWLGRPSCRRLGHKDP
jgi:hypothetical protein